MTAKKAIQQKKAELKKKLKKTIDDLDISDKKKLRAIAVKYDTKKGRAPKIIATGKGVIAEEILKLAEENQVPLLEDPDLAGLLDKLELESEIPPELYSVIAEVLAFLYQLEKTAKKRTSIRQKFKRIK